MLCLSNQRGSVVDDRLRQYDAEGFCAPEIDDRLPRRRRTGENQAAISARLMVELGESHTVAHQAAGSGKGGPLENCGKFVTSGQGAKFSACAEKKLIVSDDKAFRLRLGQFSKNVAQLRSGACPRQLDLCARLLSGRSTSPSKSMRKKSLPVYSRLPSR